MNKRAKENLWITILFTFEFALISLAYLLPGVFYPLFNPYVGIFVFLFVFGVLYPILLDLTLFDTALSILTTTLYSSLWAFSTVAGFSIYSTLINITIGVILVLLIWVLHDRLLPFKGMWGKILVKNEILNKYSPLLLLFVAIISVPIFVNFILFDPSFLNFILTLVYFAALLYLVFDIWDDVKKKYYTEKGGINGKPKPKPE